MGDATTPPSSSRSPRRTFLQTLTALGAAAVLPPPASSAAQAESPAAPWDLSWLDQLKGRHRQVFDLGTLGNSRGGPLHIVMNYVNAHRDVFNLAFPAIDAVVGIAYSAFPVNASDGMWRKYGLGERWQVKDPKTDAWAVRNIWADAEPSDPRAGETVTALRERGVILWQCNNALHNVAQELAAATHAPLEEVRADLVAGLLPGTKLIPAHTLLIGLAQEHGCTYERV